MALAAPSALAAEIIDLQCVPFARQESGIQIYGDAWTWWQQAEGRYRRGERPVVGAVMAFRPHGNSKYGHVAVVAKLVNSREVLLNHANWSPINGRRGQIERGVRAMDVSEGNDWSKVRVWYAPTQSLGVKHFPLYGFIYPEGTKLPKAKVAKADDKKTKAPEDLLPKGKAVKTAEEPKPGKGSKAVPMVKTPKPVRASEPRKAEKEPKRGKGTGLPGIANYLGR